MFQNLIQLANGILCANPPENQGVRLHVEVALAGQEVQPEEAIVAPALAHLKVGGKLPDDVLGGVTGGLVDHLHTVLVSGEQTGMY